MVETLKDIGEFGLIRRIRDLLNKEGAARPVELTVGIGDDTAAFKPRPGYEILVTCDSVVQGRHYLPRFMGARDVGRRAMVINISDIGAMGGRPRYALISLGLKEETPVRDVEEMYRGFTEVLNLFHAVVIGGNLTRSENDVFIDITLIGEAKEGNVLRRSGAGPGDIILVTGYPGRSALGLQLLFRSLAPLEHPLVRAYIKPAHRAIAGAAVAESGCASAMIDTSDGFLGDLGHLCEQSGVGAELILERFPLSKDLRDAAALLKKDPHEFFLGPSDDYELIITAAADRVAAIRSAVAASYDGPVSEVGRIMEQDHGISLLMQDGSRRTLIPEGWDHFI
jgi:thiamine-monophosphate kinase